MFYKNRISTSVLILFLGFTISCTESIDNRDVNNSPEPVSEVLTAEKQDELTPEEVMNRLKEGNDRFINNNLTPKNYMAQAEKTAEGQYPEAVVLACIDSRIPVEQIFDKGIGDIFVARVAGNFVNEDILGSIEFGTAVAGSKVVIVMGHESCGAVKSAIEDVKMGNITAMLSKIKPAVEMTEDYAGEKSTKNSDYVTSVINNNVKYTIEEMRKRSPIIAELERDGEIVIAGAFYDLDTGKVTFLK